ncbi:lytic transglycosylase domain-containing protein [Lentzea jiangxiensis]|uniref:Membrane-bound lytic murein transglycosylase B n=1 Tax=Lentzea jiangxiensis TaxID=641025 RepID=A0A1H0TC14_9PSEU|nr:lytic transglycosylase domain-containing protein [Lentzea jiangxiensis]SDP51230.1 hypothetical protein SAMN05421507_109227 [Lentzea jiangxiensis]
MAKLRGPSALSPRQKGFAVAALAAMLAPAMIVGTKLVDWVNLAKHDDIAVSLGPADVFGALHRDPAELGASGRLPLSEELSASLLADLEDGDLDDEGDIDPGLVLDDIPGVHDIPGVVLEAYLRAEDKMGELVPGCNLDWALLAGIGKVESNHANNGRVNAVGDATPKILGPVLNGAPGMAAIKDTDGGRLDGNSTWDRAVGPMQFIPETWASFGGDLNDDGNVNPNNIYDAALGAGRYLCAGGGDLSKQGDRAAAIFRYNRSDSYVQTVLKWAKEYGENVDALPLLPDTGNNRQEPTPGNPNTGNPPTNGNSGTTNPSNPTTTTTTTTTTSTTTTTTPSCPTTTTSTTSSTTTSTTTSTTPPSSTCTTTTTTTTPSTTTTTTTTTTNPPQTEPTPPPQQSSSSVASQSSTAQTSTAQSSAAQSSAADSGSSPAGTTSQSLVTSTPS